MCTFPRGYFFRFLHFTMPPTTILSMPRSALVVSAAAAFCRFVSFLTCGVPLPLPLPMTVPSFGTVNS